MDKNGKVSSFSSNGKGELRQEISDQLEWENGEIMSGRMENAILTQAIAGDWSVKHFFDVARWKGKSWRYLSALGDQSLQIQGYAMLHLIADVAGADLAEMTLRKANSTLARLHRIHNSFVAHHDDDPFAEQLHLDACEDLVQLTRETRHRFHRRVGLLLE
jgi:hypothetical protein